MDITTERPSADVAVIALAGELDGSNFERVIEVGRELIDGGASRVVLDLGGLTYMGSSGLVAIHSIALLTRGRQPVSSDDGWQAIHDIGSEANDPGDPTLHLAAPAPSVNRVLERSGMSTLFPIHPDRAAAIAAASA
ncbi:MAG TPA: STAS domain-containing protein [Candidatus Limnocylindrales bacterium]|nr:STAS domain-containing protein [Candidatus Limnocylindrales bacterium]